jgi:hypothetical protein
MVHRKGELTSAGIDRGWPHQVALPAEFVRGRQHTILHRFCNGLSLCPRHLSFYKGSTDFIVYCFRERADAELFAMHFDGELMTPELAHRGTQAGAGTPSKQACVDA